MRFVYPSDEWYLRAQAPIPPAEGYDMLLPELIENGVGMVRRFMDTWPEQQAALVKAGGASQSWVTGALFAPVLEDYAAAFSRETGIAVAVIAAPNRTFGETVTVAGLLGGEDVLAALAGRDLGEVVVLPGGMFRGPAGQALDEQTPEAIGAALSRRVYVVEEA
jgi:NifB/MoaA-like Fe-S oxidoreductase